MLIAAAEIAGIAWPLAVVAVITIGIGAAVQATIGLGMAVLAAPILALIDPDFLPVTTIVMVMPLSFGVARREREHIAWSAAGLALCGRLPGVSIGALLISSTGSGTVRLLVGISVLLAVAVSAALSCNDKHEKPSHRRHGVWILWHHRRNRWPPLAVAYQHEQPATTRATSPYSSVSAQSSRFPASPPSAR